MSKNRNNMAGKYSHTNNRPQSMNAALQHAGVDTSDFLSLRIAKADLPANSELVIQIRDKRTGQLYPVNLGDDNNVLFGKNSRFYGQTMADGHIFNPYIHRRFIASQFRELIRCNGLNGLHDAVARRYSWKYAIDQVCKEAHKLALLEHRDREAFKERSRFFSLTTISNIISDYVNEVHTVIDRGLVSMGNRHDGYMYGFGYVSRQNARPIKHRYEQLRTNVRNCHSYAELNAILSTFDFVELARHTRLTNSFILPFLEAGAFYTMKHAIMFEKKCIHGMDQKRSLDYLNTIANGKEPEACMNLYRWANF